MAHLCQRVKDDRQRLRQSIQKLVSCNKYIIITNDYSRLQTSTRPLLKIRHNFRSSVFIENLCQQGPNFIRWARISRAFPYRQWPFQSIFYESPSWRFLARLSRWLRLSGKLGILRPSVCNKGTTDRRPWVREIPKILESSDRFPLILSTAETQVSAQHMWHERRGHLGSIYMCHHESSRSLDP